MKPGMKPARNRYETAPGFPGQDFGGYLSQARWVRIEASLSLGGALMGNVWIASDAEAIREGLLLWSLRPISKTEIIREELR